MLRIRDFFITFFIDLVMRRFFTIPLIAAYALYRYGMFGVWVVWAVVGAWVGVSFISALIVTLIGSAAAGSRVYNPSSVNVNPYSRKTADYLPRETEGR